MNDGNDKNPQPTPPTLPEQSKVAPEAQQSNPNVAFKSDYIGQWAAKQDDPFAEQNRKAAEKKAAEEAARKKVLPYIKIGSIVAGCVAVIAIIVAVVIIVSKKTPISEVTAEDSAVFQEEAQEIFDKYTTGIDTSADNKDNLTEQEKEDIDRAIEEVGKYYESQANRAENNSAVVQIALDEMMFYLWNDQPEAAIAAADKLQTDTMTFEQQTGYYSLLQSAYYTIGNYERADYFYELMRQAAGDTYVEG